MRRAGALLLMALTIGCVATDFSAMPLSEKYKNDESRYFVENHGKDSRNLEQMIAEALRARGLDALSGPPGSRTEETAILVTYEDRWQWDITNYLILLRIDFRDAKTNELLAMGQSYQTSLGRKGERAIVNNVLDGIFGSQKPAASRK